MDTEWFKSAKKAANVTDAALAGAFGVERSVVNKVINGKVAFDARRAGAVARMLGVSAEEVMFRAGITEEQSIIEPDLPVAHSIGAGEIVHVVRLDLSLPMGPGALVDDYVEEEPFAFDLAYLRAFSKTTPARLRLAHGIGDSMMPTLLPYDEVLIDTTQNQLLHSDRIYAASINGGAAIKRLRPIDGGARILVISDNKTIDPYPVDAHEVRIWGRVIRLARDL